VQSFLDGWDVDLFPCLLGHIAFVNVIISDVCSSRMEGLLPVEHHGFPITVEKRDVIRGRGQLCGEDRLL